MNEHHHPVQAELGKAGVEPPELQEAADHPGVDREEEGLGAADVVLRADHIV